MKLAQGNLKDKTSIVKHESNKIRTMKHARDKISKVKQ